MTNSAFSLLSREKVAQADHPGRIWMSLTRLKTARSAVRSQPLPIGNVQLNGVRAETLPLDASRVGASLGRVRLASEAKESPARLLWALLAWWVDRTAGSQLRPGAAGTHGRVALGSAVQLRSEVPASATAGVVAPARSRAAPPDWRRTSRSRSRSGRRATMAAIRASVPTR
jgi:hypothetical protein